MFNWLTKKTREDKSPKSFTLDERRGEIDYPEIQEASRLEKAGNLEQAEALYLDILEKVPDHAKALFQLGVLCKRRGDYKVALDYFTQATDMQTTAAAAYVESGRIFEILNEHEDAIYAYEMAIHHREDYSDAYSLLVDLYKENNKIKKALAVCIKWTDICPNDAIAFYTLGILYKDIEDYQASRASLAKSIELMPELSRGWAMLGHVLLILENYDLARESLLRCIHLNPAELSAHINLGGVYRYLGLFEEALVQFDYSLKMEPNNFWARYNRAHVLLTQGRFREGWVDYDARFLTRAAHYRPLPFSPWRGESLSGKTILVFAEQGLGDEIMFASCLPDVIAQAEHCVIECEPRLMDLFRRSFPKVQIFPCRQERVPSWLKEVPPIDFQCPAGSLPRYLRNDLDDFPSYQGYLKADPDRVVYWRTQLEALGPGLKIGVSWRGGTVRSCTIRRSMTLEQLLPIFRTERTRFINLQYGDCRQDLAALEKDHGIHVYHWQEAIDDYDETAALVSALDLVITVCTSIVHLSGALNKTVWIMTPAVPEWRYMQNGVQMPWYGSTRLFRQSESGDWDVVINNICDSLQTLVNN